MVAIGCTGGRHRSVSTAGARGMRASTRCGARVSKGFVGEFEGQDMIGMVLVTHGRLADEFIAATEHVVGPQDCVRAVSIGPDDDMEQRRNDIVQAVEDVDRGNGVILLTDMFGGTPSNLAISLLDRPNVEVIAGINLPMLIKLVKVRQDNDLADAVAKAQESGRKYINVASILLQDDK